MLQSDVMTVFIAAMITAIATGLGALPFLYFKSVSDRVIALTNAAAAGLMLAACHGLIAEGIAISPERTLLGILAGLAGIVIGQRIIDGSHAPEISNLKGLDAKKALLIVGVMTVHSFAEGVGVGVSFGGDGELAGFISTAIAIHNIPEGLAIALILVPRGTTVLAAALWAIFSSLPQPIMAVPSFLFVETFEPFLPFGFGLAAGAMIWMVFAELIPESNENAEATSVATTVTLAFTAMLAFQYLLLKH
ncbi:MAG: ZIP family metal transporter [Pseudomonadota bacterium]